MTLAEYESLEFVTVQGGGSHEESRESPPPFYIQSTTMPVGGKLNISLDSWEPDRLYDSFRF